MLLLSGGLLCGCVNMSGWGGNQPPPVALLQGPHPVLSRGEVYFSHVCSVRAALENLKEAGKTNLNVFDVT